MQKLILPFNACKVTAGAKTDAYRNYWGYNHYGVDYRSLVAAGDKVIASGDGKVVTAGLDNRVGNTVCIIYPAVYNHKTGETRDLVARHMHLASIAVKAGDTVAAGTVIGIEGKTGAGGWDIHLHLEMDTDTSYPNYSPQVAGGSLIKASPKGYPDTTVTPSEVLHIGPGQSITNGGNHGWVWTADFALPVLPAPVPDKPADGELEALREEVARLEAEVTAKDAEISTREQQAGELADRVARLKSAAAQVQMIAAEMLAV